MKLVRAQRSAAWHLRPLPIVSVLAVLAVGLALADLGVLPVRAAGPRAWEGGRITYFDASGSQDTVDAAATRWNTSGVDVRISRATDRAHADVVFVRDAGKLRADCGRHCLGLSSSIGRPADGRVTIWLAPSITGGSTALGVWVAMHELGHVLGLHHREGACSLMNAHAYDDSCSFGSGDAATALPCGPAAGDVAVAASIYGRDDSAQPCR
jgi:hypothetical protein